MQAATGLAAPDTANASGARFSITTQAIGGPLLPFSATIGGIGNSLIGDGGGFEPVVIRDKLVITEDSLDRLIAAPEALSHYDSFADGFYDGADVRVYRIEGGQLKMIRSDQVARGGSHLNGWVPVRQDGQIVASDATRYAFRWEPWNRPRARYFFTVRAVDRYGNLSPPAPPIAADSPEHPGHSDAVNNLRAFKAERAILPHANPPSPRSLHGTMASDGTLTLAWDRVDTPDLAGYIVFRADVPPDRLRGSYLQLVGKSAGPALRRGDVAIVSQKFYSFSRRQLITQRLWGVVNDQPLPDLVGFFPDENPDKHWRLVPHEPNTPVTDPGETFLEIDLAAGTKESLTLFNHSGKAQTWYDVLDRKPYTGEVWLRQEGRGQVQFRITGFYEHAPHDIPPIVFDVGPKWKKYVFHFTPPVVMDGADPMGMTLDFSGASRFQVDNFRVYQSSAPFLDLLPADLEAVNQSGLHALRTHGFVRTRLRTYDLEQLTNPGGVISARDHGNTLPQVLRSMRQAGVNPWLQIEYHMSPHEWLGLVEYLAAPYDPVRDSPKTKPWAYKRFAQGQAKPWTDEFEKIYFEISNETWNSMFQPWTFGAMTDATNGTAYSPGEVYGIWQEFIIKTLRSSPYWGAAKLDQKFTFVLGGWAAVPQYGADAARRSPSSSLLAIAAYNGGWDEGENPTAPDPAGLFSILSQTPQGAIPVADQLILDIDRLKRSGANPNLTAATYEAGPGYALNGLNGIKVSPEQEMKQEQAMKSLAAGTATLDAFLSRSYRGFSLQNYFAFDRGPLWKSHAKWYRGGQAYPAWKLLSLFNNEATGNMLRTDALTVPTVALASVGRRKAVKHSPLVAVYATRRKDRLNVFVLSRKVAGYPVATDDGYTPVQIELPITRAKSAKVYRMIGPPNSNNLLTDNVKVEEIALDPTRVGSILRLDETTGADARGLPPAATYLYVFDGAEFVGAK